MYVCIILHFDENVARIIYKSASFIKKIYFIYFS